jgi:hypothetical protein
VHLLYRAVRGLRRHHGGAGQPTLPKGRSPMTYDYDPDEELGEAIRDGDLEVW